jgi:CheY-like chemotaxis protein
MSDSGATHDLHESQDMILVVDDDEISRLILSSMLKKMGFRTLCIEDGYYLTFSCEYFSTVKAILIDMHMPKLDGYKTVQKIRKLYKQNKIPEYLPIIAVTVDDNKEKCIRAGCDGYLAKPVSFEGVAAALREAGLKPVYEGKEPPPDR